MSSQDVNSPEYLEDQIEETRHHLSATLEELQSRLSPGDLFEEAVNYIKSNGEIGRNIATTVRENPIPACLMGIGLTWLIASGASGPRKRLEYHPDDSFDAAPLAGDPRFSDHPEGPTPQAYPSGGQGSQGGGAKQKMNQAKSQAAGAARQAKDKLRDAKSQLSEKASSVRDKAASHSRSHTSHSRQGGSQMQNRYHDARQKGSEMARNMQEGYHQRTHEMRHRASTLIEERPLAVAAIGIGIGAALGLMIPSTAREDRILGQRRDRLKEEAMAQGEKQFEQAREQVEKAAEAVSERVREEGQSAGRQAEKNDSAGSQGARTASSSATSPSQTTPPGKTNPTNSPTARR